MLAFMGEGETESLFKVDADRRFNQIVMTEEAVWASAFEMLGELWVSERMLLGMKNDPPTFKRNTVIMQGDLLEKHTKSYFDDIIGKSGKQNYTNLRAVWVSLLERMRKHGWKLKLRKCEWIVIVQEDDDGKEYVCCFASSGLSASQRNYHIVRLELLAFVHACGKFHEWLGSISFIWRTDCRAHQYLLDAKESPNQTIARYSLFLSDYVFKVEWVLGLKMIADPFSRMVLLPAGREAMSLVEICFGDEFGKRIFAEKSGGKALSTPILFYTPVAFMRLCDEVVLDVELEGGMSSERLIQHCMVPVTKEHTRLTTDKHLMENCEDGREDVKEHKCLMENCEDGREDVFDISTAYMEKVDLLQSEVHKPEVYEGAPDLKPLLTKGEEIKLEALKHVRHFLIDGTLPNNAVVARATRKLASKMELQDNRLWRLKHTGRTTGVVGGTAKDTGGTARVEVLDKVERIKEVLVMLHDGMGHRALGSCYNLFRQRFWVPGAAKIIARHIAACRQCQQFAKPNPLAVPGYSVSPTDIFSHWSIDFAGPFPEDVTTGAKYAILAVD